MLNSNLFGCGLNLQCTSDIVFLHKTDTTLEKQIIGRAQRPGRKDALNIWHIMHENETVVPIIKKKNDVFEITFENHKEEITDEHINDLGVYEPNIVSYEIIESSVIPDSIVEESYLF